MEHLPPVSQPFEPVLVPYIADRSYDNLEFSTYPTRRGYDLERLLEGDFQGSTPAQIASFLQTWLWFGLIHGMLNIEIDPIRLMRADENGDRWLDSSALVPPLQQAGELERTTLEEEEWSGRVEMCLNTTYHAWEGFSRLEEYYGVPNPMSPEVTFGIQVLAISLHVGATQLVASSNKPRGPVFRDKAPWERGLHIRLTRSSWLEDRMMRQGWCPLMIEQIRSQSNVIGQYYTSVLGPPHRKLDHQRCSKSDKDCVAMENHQIRAVGHESENCGCKILSVDRTRLQAIISKEPDEIPVLRLIQVNGEDELDVVSSTSVEGLEYTAMSHVWSDGWGNPNENSLPSCRVRKLIRDIKATYAMPDFEVEPAQGGWYRAQKHDDSVYFWIDTLCVPREPHDVHSRAIMQMREVYMQAERVLVYDSEIMASTAEASYEELNMRIRASRWIRRLWTLQEAVLARRLIFQFKERPCMFLTGSILWHQRQKDLKLNYYNTIGWDCDSVFHINDKMDGPETLGLLWLLLISDRSVTVESDEAICGAILMNYDMKKLMEAPISRRMQVFWQLHESSLPLAILFVAGPRILEPGFRWAPTSLLPCQRAGVRFKDIGTATDDGYRIKIPAYSAFVITSPVAELSEEVFPVVLDGAKYFVRKSPVKTNPSWEGLDLHKVEELALIIELLPTLQSDNTWSIEGSRAALVSITSRTSPSSPTSSQSPPASILITAQYLRLISVIQAGTSFHKYPSIPWTPSEIEHGDRSPSSAEWMKDESEWCLT